jgi:hypothetical protein
MEPEIGRNIIPMAKGLRGLGARELLALERRLLAARDLARDQLDKVQAEVRRRDEMAVAESGVRYYHPQQRAA